MTSDGGASPRHSVAHRAVGHGLRAVDLFAALHGDDPTAFWLDSGGDARFSILGSGSSGVRAHVVTYRVGADHVVLTHADGRRERVSGDVIAFLRGALARFAVRPEPSLPFALGYVGYLGYELRGLTMDLPVRVASGVEDAHLVFAERALVVDHETGDVHGLALVADDDPELTVASMRWLDELPGLLADVPRQPDVAAPDSGAQAHTFRMRHGHDEYLALVRSCQEHIHRGDSYELCLTNAFHAPGPVDPWATYLRLRAVSPVPYGAYLACGPVHVLSASPERFLRVEPGGRVETRPIKGTRGRGASAAEDDALRAELAASEKDRAENLMIVDLLRNDLSRVCEVGSVETSGLFAVETYPLVHQLVSTVSGQLLPGLGAVDVFVSAFPGGSMTGAPKRRSVEILDELERGARGVYSGALGWFALDGGADLSIVIRTIVTTPEGATFGAGGAITALSDPEQEYDETLVKARAMALALVDEPPAAADQ